MTGRKKDIIWNYFQKLVVDGKTGCRAKCKSCGKELQGLVSRMKLHHESCKEVISSESENCGTQEEMQSVITESEIGPSSSCTSDCSSEPPPKKVSKLPSKIGKLQSINRFLVKTTDSEKQLLNAQIARYIFATNASFHSVEHKEFKKMIEMLRPGFVPPSEKDIGGPLLQKIHTSIQEQVSSDLQNKTVCMAMDGWSNVHNEPVICVTISVPSERSIHLVDTVDTSGNSHTAEYLLKLATSSVKLAESNFKCKVRTFVTDNAANVAKMRKELVKNEDMDILSYGCSAHILNLLAHDLEIKGIKGQVVSIIKYFRNTHLPNAWYKKAGGKTLNLPVDVRWNSLSDCLESFIKNWLVMVKVCEENRSEIPQDIVNKVNNIGLKRNVEDYLVTLKPISVALDRAQRLGSIISDAVEIWKVLLEDLENEKQTKNVIEKVKTREAMAITPFHLLANILDPRYRGKRLEVAEIDSAMKCASENFPLLLPIIINYKAVSPPFTEYMFSKDTVEKVEPLSWWLCFGEKFDSSILDAIKQLFSGSASSAGVESIFSTFGFVHSKVRNRLGTEKAGKLVSVFRSLNSDTVPDKKPYKKIETQKEFQESKTT